MKKPPGTWLGGFFGNLPLRSDTTLSAGGSIVPDMATVDTDCDRCERTVERLVPAYWGEALCPDCCQLVAGTYDLVGWPPFPPSP